MKNYKHIELFAGCGGLNLGLEKVGFKLLFANEISPMAGETFAYNFLNEVLEKLANLKKKSRKVLWINSNYEKDDLKSRLRENPFFGLKSISDIDENVNLNGKLLIGDVDKLLNILYQSSIGEKIKEENVELISGGPPCQSFSLAGKREKNNAKNLLPLTFAKFVDLAKPKVVLLENVKGITSPFIENEQKYYAWLEVSKAFVLEGYYPICMMINSKYFGIPQNRPRFILLAFREDIFLKLKVEFTDLKDKEILDLSESFFKKVKQNSDNLNNVTINDYKFYDLEIEPQLFDGILLPKIINKKDNFISVKDAINDLVSDNKEESIYVNKLNNFFDFKKNQKLSNFELRTHNVITQARFRYYQILEELPIEYKRELNNLLGGKEINTNKAVIFQQISKFKFLIPNDDRTKNIERKLKNTNDLDSLILIINTKKHSQRALNKNLPAPAQLTIPDDICHYDFNTPRVLSVREMARIQSFPDWFTFKSKVTTGGKMRKYETPQYTQVGNAVPPLLGVRLGEHIYKLLKRIKE